jgi:predicted nucleic acid-binding protein
MLYFDAAFIAKFYLQEPESDTIRSFAEDVPGIASLVIGRLETELVFSCKLREGALTPQGHQALIDQCKADFEAGLWTWLPATDDLVSAAQEMIRRLPSEVFLRSLDALHLTCARRNGHQQIYSNDRHLLLAAPHFGLEPGLLSI